MAISTSPVHQAVASGTTALTITITGAASGNFLILCVALRGSSLRTVSTVTTTNVAWTNVKRGSNSTLGVEIWYGLVSGGTSGTSVTFTFSGTTTFTAGNVSEWSGVATTSILDGTANIGSGSSTSPNVPALTTIFGNDLFITAESHETGTAPTGHPSLTTTLTAATSSTSLCCQGAYKVPAAAGAQGGGTWTIASSGDTWATVDAAFTVALKSTTVLSASLATMAGAIIKADSKVLVASQAGMGGTLVKKAEKVLAASAHTMAAAINKVTDKVFNAS